MGGRSLRTGRGGVGPIGSATVHVEPGGDAFGPSRSRATTALWHICGTFVAHESEKRWFSRLNQRQRTTHEKADFEPSVRGSGALIIRRSRVQVPAAPLVSPQVRTLHAARSDPSPW